MAVSSARPQHLVGYAAHLRAAAARVEPVARDARRAALAYLASCPDDDGTLSPTLLADRVTQDLTALAARVAAVADAFTRADSGGSPLVATATDRAVGHQLLAHHAALATGELAQPVTEAAHRGRAAGEAIAAALQRDHVDDAAAVLHGLSEADTRDPVAASALVNELGAHHLTALTEALVRRSVHHRRPSTELRLLARVHHTATHTWEPGATGPFVLSRALVHDMTRTREGRNALRVLAGSTQRVAGTAYLVHLARALLLEGSAADDTGPDRMTGFLTLASEGDGDAALLGAIARSSDASYAVVHGAIPGHLRDHRLAELFEVAHHDAQDELATMIHRTVHHPRLSDPHHELEPTVDPYLHLRHRIHQDTIAAVARDPRAVRQPLAEVLADSVVEDPTYWIGRTTSPRPDQEVIAAFEAVSLHDDALRTVIIALTRRERAAIAEAVQPGAIAPTDLHDLPRLWEHLEVGAERADVTPDRASFAFTALQEVVRVGVAAAPIHPGAKAVAGPALQGAVGKAREASEPPPGDAATTVADTRDRVALRVWLAVAEAPPDGTAPVWDQRTGGITGLDDLRRSASSPDLPGRLQQWEALQDPGLRDVVRAYADRLTPPHGVHPAPAEASPPADP